MNFNKKHDYTRTRELYMEKKNDKEISDETGIPRSTIARWRQSNNLEANSNYKAVTPEESAEMERLYKLGKSDYAIATKLGQKVYNVGYWRKKNGYEPHFKSNFHLPSTPDYYPSIDDTEKPWKDPESLFCDTEFLEKLMDKPIKRMNKND